MREAAKIVEERYRPDIIDINLGCPVRKVTKTGAGASLLKDIKKLKRIVRSVVSGVSCQVSAKTRIGWENDSSLAIAEALEESGISFITVHARRAVDSYSKKAEWSVFERLKKRITVPIVANGDISDHHDVEYLLKEIGIDAVMIGRGVLGKPWVFALIRKYFENGECGKEPSLDEKIEVLLRHMSLMVSAIGKRRCARRIKKQLVYYFKGFPQAKQTLQDILRRERYEDIIFLIEQYRTKMKRTG
jgi:nifR3 family TIM-barrel protein